MHELTRDLRLLAGREDATVLLPIDQAEELFGYSDSTQASSFLRNLRKAFEASGRELMAIAIMRSDALARFQIHPDLQDFDYDTLTIDPVPLKTFPKP